MLAEFSLLLHEMSDSLLGRPDTCDSDLPEATITNKEITVVVTGLASTGKHRLVEALETRLRPAGIAVRAITGSLVPVAQLHVHADTDLDALIEGARSSRELAHRAEIVVPVDWEPVERSVTRVIEQLIARGVATAGAGV